MVCSLLRYSYCSVSLTLCTRVSSGDGLVFSKLARRKEITAHLWEGEENQCPFCASWNCIALSQTVSQGCPFCTLQHKLWEDGDTSLDTLKDPRYPEKAFSPSHRAFKNSRFCSEWSQICVLISGCLPIHTDWVSLSSIHIISGEERIFGS